MMEHKVLRTYNKMWKFERKIYSIDDIKLPIPINPDEAAYFVLGLFITLAILKVLPFLNELPFVVRYLAVPYGLMKFLTKKKFDGKMPHKFLIGYIDYLWQPRKIARFKAADSFKPGYFMSVVYRKQDVINVTDEINKKNKTRGERKAVCISFR